MSDALVIVGASLAGVKAAEGARNAGWTGPIRLVGAEPHLPYERPPLSKGVLAGREAPVSALVHGDGYEAAHDVDLLLGVTVTAIDASRAHGHARLERPSAALRQVGARNGFDPAAARSTGWLAPRGPDAPHHRRFVGAARQAVSGTPDLDVLNDPDVDPADWVRRGVLQ